MGFPEYMERVGLLAIGGKLPTLRGSLLNIINRTQWGTALLNEHNGDDVDFHVKLLQGQFKERCFDEIATSQDFDNTTLPTHPFFFMEHILHFGGGSRLVCSSVFQI